MGCNRTARGTLTAPNDNYRGPGRSAASLPDVFARSDTPFCRDHYVAGGPMAHPTVLRLRRLLEGLVASGLAFPRFRRCVGPGLPKHPATSRTHHALIAHGTCLA